ncbi:MAG: hypothetical protein JXC36_03705 [Candidatus Atribacteria bacterium]|nr:hypothetical protein [Candidatus Atribacteria bacterium]
MDKDLKRDRFIKVAERRVTKILNDLDSLSNCSNRRNYQYNDEDIKKIFQAIEKKVKAVRDSFSNTKNKKDSFSLK